MKSTPRGLLRIGLFFAIGTISAFALDFLIDRTLRKAESAEIGIWNQIVRGDINVPILISGSSRGLVHYNSLVIQDALHHGTFNISLNASRTDLQLARLRTYLNHNTKPKLLIQNLDTHSLALTRGVYDPGQFVPFLSEEPLYSALAALDPAVWKWKYIPLYGYAVEDFRHLWFFSSLEVLGFRPPAKRLNGFEPRHLPWSGDFDSFREANPTGVTIDFEPEGIRILQELISLCKSQEIDVVLVYSPEYFEMIPLANNRQEIFDTFRRLAQESGVPFLDYSDSPLCKKRDNFYNSQHMNATSATAFSLDLAARLQDLELNGQIQLGIVTR